ncbi:MAG: 5-formyltetrahydrofolate cyclo-ligase [Clostridiales bacterium]|nr:5-formyltetrahydrofolate cyclo-ligase [Clostridiales bacterium]
MTDFTGDEEFAVFAEALEKAAKKDAKKRRRAAVKRQAAALTPAYREQAGRAIAQALLESEEFRSAKTVFCYVSVGEEPDTAAFLDAALAAGRKVAVPRCLGRGVMEAVLIESRSDLSKTGAYGIPEPADGLPVIGPEALDLLIVPCVACSREGARLGHGMGYYDRFLEQSEGTSVALCYEALLQEKIPEEPHDKRPDLVLSEAAWYPSVQRGE